jgi:hypothetical protein
MRWLRWKTPEKCSGHEFNKSEAPVLDGYVNL